ncbi:hypothetical protein HPB48_010610 [Haemaphysalis longicornis]|uniref:Ionotropic receptor n=1 Tax=Haemaphysalis longicornis TaxID=44386 RepID=A0A9J6FQH6_HAELO|nr:hypothetical protein HPB48_010610 [Haemaphysalis longicornis]
MHLRKKLIAFVPTHLIAIDAVLKWAQEAAPCFRDVHWVFIVERDASEPPKENYKKSWSHMSMSIYTWRKYAKQENDSNASISQSDVCLVSIYNTSEFLVSRRLPSPTLPGNTLKVLCLQMGPVNYCEHRHYKFALRLLNFKNVSVVLKHASSFFVAWNHLSRGEVDMLLHNFALSGVPHCSLEFINADVLPETFYARANGTRVITFLEVLSASNLAVTLTVSTLTLCSIILALMNCGCVLRKFPDLALREAMFLISTLLSQSSPFPPDFQHASHRRGLYIFLLLSTFPLSVFIRGQLTSSITVTRPADPLDTMAELETALDANSVAICVKRGTSQFNYMLTASNSPSSLGRKLYVASQRPDRQFLVTPTTSDCIVCTHKTDRVCFTIMQPECMINEVSPHAKPFSENFGMVLVGLPARNGLPMKPALRRLFLRASETSLRTEAAPHCKFQEPRAPMAHNVEVVGFIKQYIGLQAVSVLVFWAEYMLYSILKCHVSPKRLIFYR